MAKRKRLTPTPSTPGVETRPIQSEAKPKAGAWHQGPSRPAPIAEVAGSAAAQAALEEVAGEMSDARREGRLVQRIALDAIDETYLVRDRLDMDPEELEGLIASLRSRGQQTPLEVVDLGEGRFGLISGWRRLVALKRLRDEEEGAKDALSLIRAPETATDAYVAMVEENEIRAGLSFYERARIAMRATEQGAYQGVNLAVRGLFANASASKRSKIGAFVQVYQAFDTVLKFPNAISEKLGLALAKQLTTYPEARSRFRERLRTARAKTVEQELALLNAMVAEERPGPQGDRRAPEAKPKPAPKVKKPAVEPKPAPEPAPVVARIAWNYAGHSVNVGFDEERIVLTGSGVDRFLKDDLVAFLENRHKEKTGG